MATRKSESRTLKSTDVFLALGRRGSGKSYLARKLSESYPRRVIFDPVHEYNRVDGRSICTTFEGFCQKMIETEKSERFTIVWQSDVERSDERARAEFNEAMRILWYRGNVMIHVEEVQEFCGTHGMPQWLKNNLLTGRHRNNGLIFTTQRPGECHKTIVSQANHVFCGPLHEKNDVDYVRMILGERANQLLRLPDRQFYYFRPSLPLLHITNDLKTLAAIP